MKAKLGRMRASTLVLIVAFLSLFWVYHNFEPQATPAEAPTTAVVPPGFTGTLPAGVKRIQSPTNLVWVLGRTLVQDAADMPAVTELMRGYRFTALDPWVAGQRQAWVQREALNDAAWQGSFGWLP